MRGDLFNNLRKNPWNIYVIGIPMFKLPFIILCRYIGTYSSKIPLFDSFYEQ